jgi:hypothetical protein
LPQLQIEIAIIAGLKVFIMFSLSRLVNPLETRIEKNNLACHTAIRIHPRLRRGLAAQSFGVQRIVAVSLPLDEALLEARD